MRNQLTDDSDEAEGGRPPERGQDPQHRAGQRRRRSDEVSPDLDPDQTPPLPWTPPRDDI